MSGGDDKKLQMKIKQFEAMLKALEKEKAELKSRCTMAESQNKTLTD